MVMLLLDLVLIFFLNRIRFCLRWLVSGNCREICSVVLVVKVGLVVRLSKRVVLKV